eukprot:4484826-Alexandrium_andersonii.AAC.1
MAPDRSGAPQGELWTAPGELLMLPEGLGRIGRSSRELRGASMEPPESSGEPPGEPRRAAKRSG